MNIETEDPNSTLNIKFGDIERVQKSKYIGEILTQNMNEKPTIEDRARNVKMTFRLFQCRAYQAKFRHYAFSNQARKVICS